MFRLNRLNFLSVLVAAKASMFLGCLPFGILGEFVLESLLSVFVFIDLSSKEAD